MVHSPKGESSDEPDLILVMWSRNQNFDTKSQNCHSFVLSFLCQLDLNPELNTVRHCKLVIPETESI